MMIKVIARIATINAKYSGNLKFKLLQMFYYDRIICKETDEQRKKKRGNEHADS